MYFDFLTRYVDWYVACLICRLVCGLSVRSVGQYMLVFGRPSQIDRLVYVSCLVRSNQIGMLVYVCVG